MEPRVDDASVVDVPRGARALVVADLLLPEVMTDASASTAAVLAAELEGWQGPGALVIAGNLIAPSATTDVARLLRRVLAAHDRLRHALERFCAEPGRTGIAIPGARDGELGAPTARAALGEVGLEVAGTVELRFDTASGTRRVVVEAATPVLAATPVHPSAEWLVGEERLEDPALAPRFLGSRLRYRRLRSVLWLAPIIALCAVVATRIGVVATGLDQLTVRQRIAHHVVERVVTWTWPTRLAVTLLVVLLAEVAVAVAASVLASRRYPGLLGDRPRSVDPLEALGVDGALALDRARAVLARGADGYVVGGSARAAIAPIAGGFVATPGSTSEVVCELPGRFGLPAVFLSRRRAGLLELEAGTVLHARLLLGDAALPGATLLERVVSKERRRDVLAPLRVGLVASWPGGRAWPTDPDALDRERRERLARRLASGAIVVAGLANVAVAAIPPLRSHLHAYLRVVPIGVSQAASAVVAVTGVALLLLARGVRRGQRRAWSLALVVLGTSVIAHVARSASIVGTLVSVAVLGLLLWRRGDFRGESDRTSLTTAWPFLLLTCVVAVAAATIGIEASNLRARALPSISTVVVACIERLAGYTGISLPDRVDDLVTPALLAIGLSVALVAVYLATRPVVDRRLSEGTSTPERRAAELRARDLVRRHGFGTLDYFALRDDKQWFFHRETLVAYAVYGGVCLVSPDPIGPEDEREEAFSAFRSFADAHGWTIGVIGAGESWLPLYAEAQMRYLYLGDEAVVDVQAFSLSGGRMKGLRQACTRLERHGYTVEFLDPSAIDPTRVQSIVELMALNRRGDDERGFSMVLGRIFHEKDSGLLFTLVSDPDGRPAAMCQFVPTPALRGFSLDLMRRDPGEHPNGLLDFALCRTIEHLKAQGARGLSLNFAAFRSILDGERGEGVTTRAERWALRRLSGIMPIETLWRFNAKYEPSWLPRYLVYPGAESFLPVVMATLRAESITELPVVGRLFLNDASSKPGTVVPESLLAGASHRDRRPSP